MDLEIISPWYEYSRAETKLLEATDKSCTLVYRFS